MCLGSYEIAGVCATPLIIIILPIVGIYRLVQCIFYDIPIYLFRLTRVPTSGEAFPYGSAIRVNTVKTQREVQEVRVDVQPQVLRITIPVSEDHVSEDPV